MALWVHVGTLIHARHSIHGAQVAVGGPSIPVWAWSGLGKTAVCLSVHPSVLPSDLPAQ